MFVISSGFNGRTSAFIGLEGGNMSLEKIKTYFAKHGLSDRIKVFQQSSATVQLAALALGCQEGRIAKTISVFLDEKPVLIVVAGDMKIDNRKYKACFQQKLKMIPPAHVKEYVGYEPGSVCPFALESDIPVYLDISLKRFETVYPAAGTYDSAVELSLSELEICSLSKGWIDVCQLKTST